MISVAMAILVLVSTLSVSIGKHYCGDHLVDMAIFSEAKDCGMEMSDKNLESSVAGPVIKKKTCCTDVVDLFEGQDELSLEKTHDLKTDQKVFILSFVSILSGLNLLEQPKDPPFEHYSPPTYVKDIQVLNEVFLIWFSIIIISELP